MTTEAPDYATTAIDTLRDVGESPIGGQLSPMVQLGISIYGIADEMANAIEGGNVNVSRMALTLGTSMLQEMLPLIAGQIGSSLAEAIPLIGGTISAILDAQPGGLSQTEVETGRRDQCLNAYVPVTSTMASGAPSPADYFVGTDPLTGAPNGKMPNLGRALIAITETYGPLPFAQTEQAFGASIGIPSDVRALFSRLRHGMQSAYNTGSGGAELLPAYLDALDLAVRKGWLTLPYGRYLLAMSQVQAMVDGGNGTSAPFGIDAQAWIHLGGEGQVNLLAMKAFDGGFNTADLSWLPPDVCARWDQRGLEGAFALRTSWSHVVAPTYDLDKQTLESSVRAGIQGILEHTPDVPQNRLVLLALSIASHKVKPRIRLHGLKL